MNQILKTTALACIFTVATHAAETPVTAKDSMATKDTTKNYSNFSVFGEYTLKSAPTPLQDEWHNGIGGGVGYEIYDMGRLSAVGSAAMRVFSFDDEQMIANLKDSINTSELQFDISPLMMIDAAAGLKFRAQPEGFSPYAAASLGYLLVFGGNGTIHYRGFELEIPAIDADAVLLKASAGIQYKNKQKIGFYTQGSAVYGISLGGDNYGYFPMELGITVPVKL